MPLIKPNLDKKKKKQKQISNLTPGWCAHNVDCLLTQTNLPECYAYFSRRYLYIDYDEIISLVSAGSAILADTNAVHAHKGCQVLMPVFLFPKLKKLWFVAQVRSKGRDAKCETVSHVLDISMSFTIGRLVFLIKICSEMYLFKATELKTMFN